jgi:hypothetical protein
MSGPVLLDARRPHVLQVEIQYSNRRFNRQISEVLGARPIVEARWVIVSMVCSRDLIMYILCIKAFYRRMGGGRIIAIIPADLPESERALLRGTSRASNFR